MRKSWQGIIREYQEFLPVSEKTPVVTLLEGNTPLVEADNLAKYLNFEGKIYLKLEGLNPTGSFKDRGMTMAVSKALEEGSRAIICASTGNTSASAAAYGAKAGIRVVVLVPAGQIAMGKLAQALIYGAKVLPLAGNFDDCLKIVKEISQKYPIILVNSLNPYRIEGQKTAAFEICQVLERSPDYHFIPVGNAGNITAYYRGYKEYYLAQQNKKAQFHYGSPYAFNFVPPKMMGWQAEGAAPIVLGHRVDNPQTVASAIKIGNPAQWQEALGVIKDSSGKIGMVSDQDILAAQKLLASLEGVFCEPASAVSLAGFIKEHQSGSLKNASLVVFTLTGSGLKDPDTVIKSFKKPKVIQPKIDKILKEIGF